ncbi:DNA-binding transcriptional regulator, PadR family [Pseudonocardia ammonioxydans]|uniref:DNA-binding transcriptional regulator, PadR family n=1 Tax=Pseudonocardia ammonioxydans TaxID=260086 RepID=A0A1I4TGN8_PSUAM|nr:hypothetical protein [Pseudonocardia ammonioxydans]SFM75710.1 DNA-binding transcriptional regulator, PadR family [Pseudonocardia ammonioxydans]
MVRIEDRSLLDLLLLGAVATAPGDGAAVLRAVHERSDRAVELSRRVGYRALHRLERNRLVHRPDGSGYRLTAAGTRSLRIRRREYDEQVRAVRAVTSGPGAAADRAGRVRGSGPRA